MELGPRRGAAARARRHPRPRQRAGPDRVGGLRHGHPGRGGRRGHDDRRHAAEQHSCRRRIWPHWRTKRERARGQAHVDVGFWGGAVPDNLSDLRPLHEAGVFGFKCFLVDSGVSEFPPLEDAGFSAAMAETARSGALLIVHAEDASVISQSPPAQGVELRALLAFPAGRGRNPGGRPGARRGPPHRGRVHILHVSSADVLPQLRAARDAGVDVTAETCPHYLTVDAAHIPDGATQFKCCPRSATTPTRNGSGPASRTGTSTWWSRITPPARSSSSGWTPETSGRPGAAWRRCSSAWPSCGPRPGRGGTHSSTSRVGWPVVPPTGWDWPARAGSTVGADADLVVFAPEEEFVVDPRRSVASTSRVGLRRAMLDRCRPADLVTRRAHRPGWRAPRPAADERREMTTSYYAPTGGLPGQTELTTDRAVFTEAYAVLPRGTMRDIVTSFLPFWEHTRLWVIARPLSGFAETFSQYIVEVSPGGGSERPETDPIAEAVLFVVEGALQLTIEDETHELGPGGYAYLPARCRMDAPQPANPTRPGSTGFARPTNASTDLDVRRHSSRTSARWRRSRCPAPTEPGPRRASSTQPTCGTTCTSTSSTSCPGARSRFPETHVMEHGLYVLEGKAVYLLNRDWVEVEAGDFMWLRAFCPQACYAGGPGRFRYLLYKDVNRHAPLSRQLV